MAPIHAVTLAVVLAGCSACGAVDTPLPSDAGLSELDQERATVEILACDAAGSGVIVSKRHVLTAFHVVAGCGLVVVKLHDGSVRIAALEIAHVSDLARLRILDEDVPDYRPPVATAGIGDTVCLTAAHPERVRECGAVKFYRRDRKESGDTRFGATVVKGNSGGPAWRDGFLVGITVQCDLADDSSEETPKCAERGGGFTSLERREWIATDLDMR